MHTIRVTLAIAIAAMLSLPSLALADDEKICLDFVAALEGAGEDCDATIAVLEDLASRPGDIASISGSGQTDACADALGPVMMTKFEACGSKLEPALDKIQKAEHEAKMATPDGVIGAVIEGATLFYQEEHADPDDPMRVTSRLYPLSEAQVCSDDAGNSVWGELRFDPKNTDLTVCYQSTADRKSVAIAVKGGGKVHCAKLDALDLSDPTTVKSTGACLVDGGKAAAGGAAKKPAGKTTAGEKKKAEKKKAEKKKAPPSVDEVAALCAYWTDSVERFGDQCPALGKRMYRKARDLPWRLRDVPRNGDYDDALAVCTKAAKASSHCANDKEFESAMEYLGN